MQEVSLLKVDHNIIRVSISKTQDVTGDTIACSRTNESVSRFVQLFFPVIFVVLFEMFGQEVLNNVIGKGLEDTFFILDSCQSCGVTNEF